MLDKLIDLLARALDALGLHGTRLRWRWNQRRQQLGESGLQALMFWRSARAPHKMCPSCRALVPRGAGRCPECSAPMAGVRAPGLGRALSNLFPGATTTTALILLVNGFWFALMVMVLIRSGRDGGFSSLLFFPDDFGRTLVRFGALYTPLVQGPADWWRLIPPIFLHAGLLHFFFNCYVFLQLAPTVEEEYGTERFFVAYLASGIAGFALSLGWSSLWGGFKLTLGASGAILGLMGLLIAYGVRRGGAAGERVKSAMLRYLLYILAFSLLMGSVDHAAHIGGLVTGFALGFVLPYGPYRDRRHAALWQTLAAVGVLAVVYAFARVAFALV